MRAKFYPLILFLVFIANHLWAQEECSSADDLGAISSYTCTALGTDYGGGNNDAYDPGSGCTGSRAAQWIRFTAGETSTIMELNAARNYTLSLYSGPCGSLTEEACQSGTGTITLTAPTNVGQTYYLRVIYDGGGGSPSTDLCVYNGCSNETYTDMADAICNWARHITVDDASCTPGNNAGKRVCTDNFCQTTGEYFAVFSFTAPANGLLNLDMTMGTADTVDVLYFQNTGSCPSFTRGASLCYVEVGGDGDVNDPDISGLTPGATYYILVASEAADTGSFDICLHSVQLSDPCSPIVVSPTTCTSGGTYTNEDYISFFSNGFYQSGCADNNEYERIFEVTPTRNTLEVTVNNGTMGGQGAEITLMTRSGTCTDEISYTIEDASCPGFGGTAVFSVTAGTTYLLAIDHKGSFRDRGTFDICLDEFDYTPPSGGTGVDCANAIPITSFPFFDLNATNIGFGDDWSQNCNYLFFWNSPYPNIPFEDKWYSYTSTGDEYITYSFTPNSYEFGDLFTEYAHVSVRRTCPDSLTEPMSFTNGECVFNDFLSGDISNSRGSDFTTEFNDIACKPVYLETAGTYYFTIESWSIDWGSPALYFNDLANYDFQVSRYSQASNDDCSNPVIVGQTQASGNNGGCNYGWDSNDPGADDLCATSIENTAWYQFTTGPTSTTVDISFSNVVGSLQYGVFEGPCGGPYTKAGNNMNNDSLGLGVGGWGRSDLHDPCFATTANHTTTIINLSPSTTYWLAVDGNAGTQSYFDFSVSNVVVLPMDIVSFTGEQQSEGNHLEWVTTNEEGVEKYILERSENGMDFYPIHRVEAQNKGSNYAVYSFLDEQPKGSDSYYRLSYLSEGKREYMAKVVHISNGDFRFFDALGVYPNPAVVQAELEYALDERDAVDVEVYDMQAKQVYARQNVVSEAGKNSITLKVNHLAMGQYMALLRKSNGEQKALYFSVK